MCVTVLMYLLVTLLGRDILRENQARKKRLKREKKETKEVLKEKSGRLLEEEASEKEQEKDGQIQASK